MPGFIVSMGQCGIGAREPLVGTIDPLSSARIGEYNDGQMCMYSAWLKGDPLASSKFCHESSFVACLSGNPVGCKPITWEASVDKLRIGDYTLFLRYEGAFAIAVIDLVAQNLYVVSDRRSQQPVFYYQTNDSLIISTALSTFSRSRPKPAFNKKWLYEFMYFNYPIAETTFFEGVYRMPPASILMYSIKNHRLSVSEYADVFTCNDRIDEQESILKAQSVFRERVPAYFTGASNVAVSITKGLDSRSVLSLATPTYLARIQTYTYGMPGAPDIVSGSKLASKLNVPHRPIEFDCNFEKKLWRLLFDTVRLSNGLEKVTRSTLLHVYSVLTNEGQQCPVTVTGVSGDHLFRDHIRGFGNVPTMIYSDMMRTIQEGRPYIDKDVFSELFRADYSGFEQHIYEVVSRLSSRYGKLNQPESYLRYLLYEATRKHFSGELAIADNFTSFRTPFWDSEIIQFAFDTSLGTIGFSESLRQKDSRTEPRLMASIISENVRLQNSMYRNLPIKTYTKEPQMWELPYKLYRRSTQTLLRGIGRTPPLEDWRRWLAGSVPGPRKPPLSLSSPLAEYVPYNAIKTAFSSNNIHWISKFLTADIIMNLIDNAWADVSSRYEPL
jgi:asparagine synthetase B (glutamine-hydrolysing)